MNTMNMSWQSEPGGLGCTWSEVGRRDAAYDAPWMHEAAQEGPSEHVSTPMPAFTTISPFGGGHWYAAHPLR